jgi:retron-type reverse transcriptase
MTNKNQIRAENEFRLRSTSIYNSKIAKTFHKTEYYDSIADSINNYEETQNAKARLSTTPSEKVLDIFEENVIKGQTTIENTWKILNRIYIKNTRLAKENGIPPTHSNLLSLLAKVPLLLLAYSEIKGNKGATTVAAQLSIKSINNLDPEARDYINKVAKCPDGMSLEIFEETSKLILKGNYPWGASRRIYIPKPGTTALRPLTIPPFMDKVVQTAIKMLLETIYEPWFDKLNCSFGFRSGKGCHDAIYRLTRPHTIGMTLALEADIEGAYPNVDRDILISTLGERIHDKKFLKLLSHRMNLETLDSKTNKYSQEEKGIPQGGTDSPYLWNIYFHKFDIWINQYLSDFQKDINSKTLIRKNQITKNRKAKTLIKGSSPQIKQVEQAKIKLKKIIQRERSNKNKTYRYHLYKKLRLINHKRRKLPSFDGNTNPFKYTYTRYADDFVILINGSKLHLAKIKKAISQWLLTNLGATLSELKSLITDLRDNPAHFLGFELQTFHNRKIIKKLMPIKLKGGGVGKIKTLVKVSGYQVNSSPDRKRLINRFHMKGYSDKNGFPICITWLSCLQAFIIIERFNAVIRGFANYYTEFSYSPSLINRWVYILRYSCLKTLAAKYHSSIRNIVKQYATSSKEYGKTIKIPVTIQIDNKTYIKYWSLLTYKKAKEDALKLKRSHNIQKTFDEIEKNKIPIKDYKSYKRGVPPLNDENWIEKINWINIRTQASFELPCAICGSSEEIEMHHIKHVRKNKFSMIDNQLTFAKMMFLRNRKQIPVCKECHKEIHAGDYQGANLNTFSIYRGTVSATKGNKLFDNNIINSENFIHNSKDIYAAKTLTEKGWKLITNQPTTRNDLL